MHFDPMKNQKGFSLLQTLVAISIAGILTYSMTSMIGTSVQQEMNLRAMIDSRDLHAELGEMASLPNCGLARLATPGSTIPIEGSAWTNEFKIPLDDGIRGAGFTLTNESKYGWLQVEEIALTPYRDRTTNEQKWIALDTPDPTDFASSVVIKGSLTVSYSTNGTDKAPSSIPVVVRLNAPGGEITSCEKANSENAQLQELCTGVGGSFDLVSNKCALPCPSGFAQQDGTCVSSSASDENIYCKVNERCGISAAYIFN